MPIYEFQCARCEHVWDELRKLSDPIPEACPNCASAELAQRMTAAAFRLKGAGWYETDFKKDGDNKRNLVDSSSGDAAANDSSSAAPASDATPTAAANAASTPAATPSASTATASTPPAPSSPAPSAPP